MTWRSTCPGLTISFRNQSFSCAAVRIPRRSCKNGKVTDLFTAQCQYHRTENQNLPSNYGSPLVLENFRFRRSCLASKLLFFPLPENRFSPRPMSYWRIKSVVYVHISCAYTSLDTLRVWSIFVSKNSLFFLFFWENTHNSWIEWPQWQYLFLKTCTVNRVADHIQHTWSGKPNLIL